ncbi:MAG: hypothetical protein CFE28_00955 [Alphaproteobacteria bacterium PA2]|nr:MAG: hypothetical protein CFE28_00955 [Alphaproteobacteria bacterium PA2]
MAVLAFLLLQAVGAQAASFDCALARAAIEVEICRDPVLSEADSLMGRLYFQAKTSAFRSGPSNQLGFQRTWARERQDCLTPEKVAAKAVRDCLRSRYEARNRELAVATVLSDPPTGLDVLDRLDPKAAPLYRAIRTYVRTPSETAYLTRLLKPYFDRMASDEAQGYGQGILADEKILKAQDMLGSDHRFAMGLKILSAYLDGPLTLPCEAVLNRPGLLETVQPIFGSTLDNFIPRTDCVAALPPLPKFEALVMQIYKGWPECEGTIRFAAYRTFDAEVEAARLADGSGKVRTRPAPRLKGVAPDAIAAATTELAKYYQTYRLLPPAKAQATAFGSVHQILASGHACS